MKKIICSFILICISLFGEDNWSENLKGVKTKLDTEDKIIALTLDACGSSLDSYDERIINFLIENEINATLFLSGKWIKKFPDKVKYLSEISYFEIENHGLNHKPCSVDGKSIYGIKGTESVEEMIGEIKDNILLIEKITGKKSKLYRSGTAYYDKESIDIILNELNLEIIGFSILGDAGACFTEEETYNAIKKSKNGDIIIAHMNRPDKEAGKGIVKAIEYLKKEGYKFVKLKDYTLK